MLIYRSCGKLATQTTTKAHLKPKRLTSEGKQIMKKVICKVEYDTDTAEFVNKKVIGAFGDAEGYEECLFKTPDGKFFLYGNGGENSIYPVETIKRMSAANAEKWLAE